MGKEFMQSQTSPLHAVTTTSAPVTRNQRLHRATVELLGKASINVNGSAPWDMQIKAAGVPERAFSQGNLGLGEAYMDGAWDAEELDEFFARLLGTRLTDQIQP